MSAEQKLKDLGLNSLPMGIPVEIEMIVEVEPAS